MIRALDCLPGRQDIVVGTNRSDIWEVSGNVPEHILTGHTGVLGSTPQATSAQRHVRQSTC